jgi:tRNA(fMet)-specific endonuclease VapC
MVKRIALDTNTAIALLNNQEDVVRVINKFETICLPITVCGELIFGAKNSGLSTKNEKKYLQFIYSCELLEINMLVANAYAELRLQLKKKGKPIPENDIWIAATCIVNNTALYTLDKHFKHISDISMI